MGLQLRARGLKIAAVVGGGGALTWVRVSLDPFKGLCLYIGGEDSCLSEAEVINT